MMRKLATLLLGCAIAMGGNVGADQDQKVPGKNQKVPGKIWMPLPPTPQLKFESEKRCGDAAHSSITNGWAVAAGSGTGLAAGGASGFAIGTKIGLACTGTLMGTDFGTCTVIGALVGGAVGAVAGIGAANLWKKVAGEHNCAASIYMYTSKDGTPHLTATHQSESIGGAQANTERVIRSEGGSNPLELVSFDAWETRCAAYSWGWVDGEPYPYVGIGPSGQDALKAYRSQCKSAGATCQEPNAFCNSWKWFAWDHWD